MLFMCREHDKGPDDFCAVLLKLLEAGKKFKVSFLGSHTTDVPGLNLLSEYFCIVCVFVHI